MMPLSIVVAINSFKNFLEDWKRKKSDDAENDKKCLILGTNKFEIRKWKDVKVGNIMKIRINEEFPADMILLKSSEANGMCYVETKNLDGETNLKNKITNKELSDLSENEDSLTKLKGTGECKAPNEHIYEFNANIKILNNIIHIDNKNFLLRGCTLKQTEYVYGLVVYVGHNTKIMKNSPKAKTKISRIEYIMNKQLIMIFLLQIVLSIFGAIMNQVWTYQHKTEMEYYIFNTIIKIGLSTILARIGTWILIFTNLVPISLLVTLEMVKYAQGIFISWDRDLYDTKNNIATNVQTSTLNEELGQVNVNYVNIVCFF
jgi:phospholipid-transporting ATPase